MTTSSKSTTLTAIDQAIDTHLQLMEHHISDMLESIKEVQQDLSQGHRNAAIGGLFACEDAYTQVGTLYHAIMSLHRNAPLIERHDDS